MLKTNELNNKRSAKRKKKKPFEFFYRMAVTQSQTLDMNVSHEEHSIILLIQFFFLFEQQQPPFSLFGSFFHF